MNNNNDPVDGFINKIVDAELQLDIKKAELRNKYPDYEKEKAELDKLEAEVDDAKKAVTKYLSDKQDYDLHKVAGHQVSITRVVKMEVEDIEKIPDDLKEMKTDWTVDIEEAKNRVKVLGGMLPGFKDKSFYRLNFKKVKNA